MTSPKRLARQKKPVKSQPSVQLLPSNLLPRREIADPEFSFPELLSNYPSLSWAFGDVGDGIKAPPPLPPAIRIEGKRIPEFSFSKLVSENPSLSFYESSESSTSQTSPTPVTVIQRFLGSPSTSEEKSEERLFDTESLPVTTIPRRTSQSPLWEGVEEEMEQTDSEICRHLSEIRSAYESADTSSLELAGSELDRAFRAASSRSTSSADSGDGGYESPRRKVRRSSRSTLMKLPQHSGEETAPSEVSSYFQPTADQLDRAARLFLLKHQSPPVMKKPPKDKPPYSTVIDPFAVGLVVTQKVLREDTILQDELKMDEKSMDWLKRRRHEPCPCDVLRHPLWWSQEIINNVHKHSFLLDCKDLVITNDRVIGSNNTNTIIVYNVPMVDGQPWKKKAEQVLRFTDIEVGVGDQTAYELMYYRQPCDRKIFLVIASNRVMGLVVAEKQLAAHRILTETISYRDLEEKPVPVRVGINRLWVHVSMRQRHLATLLCDFVGQLFYVGERLRVEDYAFNSSISDAGVAFAKIFLKTHRVPLYKGKSGVKI